MYVCICNALSEKAVRSVAQREGGPSTTSEIFRCLGAAPQCGKCISHAMSVYHDERGRAASSQ
ncbi:(2Fe-2S)-binding protein [Govanella unica]|uniref:Bacterioferritin-associated ferredoxin n=1 Tax=Govanella unica TaxID=2975056 RepID=A0A9X3TZL7_9PROT|nr:(2Fe-2S)-binding protein [Govania unica]MDA5194695.1 (2Fe-2S)-binding protein [Govania unica]